MRDERKGPSSGPPSAGIVEHRGRGIALRIGAVTAFGAMIAAVKYGSLHGVATVELIFYRNFFALPAILGWVMVNGGFAAVKTRRPAAHAIRAAIGLTSMFVMFLAVTLLPLAESTAIGFSTPLFATILSALVLREKVMWHRWAAIVLGFVGVLIVIRPGAGAVPLLGGAVALVGAFGAAVVVVTLRQIGATESATATTFWFTLACVCVTALPMPFVFAWHAPHVWISLVLCGLVAGFGQIMMTAGLRYAPVSVLAPFDYLQIIWATVWSYFLFDALPSGGALAGAALIALSGCYVVWRERRMRTIVVPSPSEL